LPAEDVVRKLERPALADAGSHHHHRVGAVQEVETRRAKAPRRKWNAALQLESGPERLAAFRSPAGQQIQTMRLAVELSEDVEHTLDCCPLAPVRPRERLPKEDPHGGVAGFRAGAARRRTPV